MLTSMLWLFPSLHLHPAEAYRKCSCGRALQARRFLAEQSVSIPISNIVFMGMGEPLHNYDAVMASIEVRHGGMFPGLGAFE